MVAMLCGGALPQQKYRRFLFGHYCIFDSSSEWSYHISLNNQHYLERRFTKKHKVGYMQVQNTCKLKNDHWDTQRNYSMRFMKELFYEVGHHVKSPSKVIWNNPL